MDTKQRGLIIYGLELGNDTWMDNQLNSVCNEVVRFYRMQRGRRKPIDAVSEGSGFCEYARESSLADALNGNCMNRHLLK